MAEPGAWDELASGSLPNEAQHAYIPTVGECAQRVLVGFERLRNAVNVDESSLLPATRDDTIDFIDCCLTLVQKFPTQFRVVFELDLPFTRLELEIIRRTKVLDDLNIVDLVTPRLLEWASRSPIFVDEANVHAAHFLARLTPHLDLWRDRQKATAIANAMKEG